MELFLDEPRYRYRVFGFFTPAPAARKFRSAGIAMSLLIGGLGLLAAAEQGRPDPAIQVALLVIAAWVFSYAMRLCGTAVMWVVEKGFVRISRGTPSLRPTMQVSRRVYWALIEVGIATTFLALLIQALVAALNPSWEAGG